ncbi:uncharacterized protein [Procambarus clarkii]|uniref:uncharacterized protein isoform X1 n=1 Tax=Procambarus clarkii TaxID=6728 RepID=UPI0037435CE1
MGEGPSGTGGSRTVTRPSPVCDTPVGTTRIIMNTWKPTKCCCCSLRTGSLVVGALALIGAVLDLINGCVGTFAFVINQLAKLKLISCLEDEDSTLCADQSKKYVLAFSFALIICEAIQAIVCCMLIHGIRKEKPKFMVPYITWSSVRVGIFITLSVVSIVIYISMPAVLLALLATMIILALIEVVYLLFVCAHYIEMKQAQCATHVLLEEEIAEL